MFKELACFQSLSSWC